jgi:hypothetical protein
MVNIAALWNRIQASSRDYISPPQVTVRAGEDLVPGAVKVNADGTVSIMHVGDDPSLYVGHCFVYAPEGSVVAITFGSSIPTRDLPTSMELSEDIFEEVPIDHIEDNNYYLLPYPYYEPLSERPEPHLDQRYETHGGRGEIVSKIVSRSIKKVTGLDTIVALIEGLPKPYEATGRDCPNR